MNKTLPLIAALALSVAIVFWLVYRTTAQAPSSVAPIASIEREASATEPIKNVARQPTTNATDASSVADTTPSPPAEEQVPLGYPALVLADALQGDHTYVDALLGVQLKYPEGWSVRSAGRWGELNRKTTVFLRPPEGSRAVPSMYYQLHVDAPPGPEGVEAFLLEQAAWKENSRRESGMLEYQNDPGSFVFRTFDGNPSMSYFATYVRGDEVQAEYFMRVLGPAGYVMFFMKGPVEDVQAQIPAIFEMGRTVKPPGAP